MLGNFDSITINLQETTVNPGWAWLVDTTPLLGSTMDSEGNFYNFILSNVLVTLNIESAYVQSTSQNNFYRTRVVLDDRQYKWLKENGRAYVFSGARIHKVRI